MAAERAEKEARRTQQQEERLAEVRRKREDDERKRREDERVLWRKWTRRVVVNNLTAQGERSLRIAIRLPSGTRVIHSFSSSSTLTALYAVVDAQFIPEQSNPADDPASLPGQAGLGEKALEAHIASFGCEDYWGFRIASAYPRVGIPWKKDMKLIEIDQLKGGGQVVVEIIGNGRKSIDSVRSHPGGDEDDGYDTEDSE